MGMINRELSFLNPRAHAPLPYATTTTIANVAEIAAVDRAGTIGRRRRRPEVTKRNLTEKAAATVAVDPHPTTMMMTRKKTTTTRRRCHRGKRTIATELTTMLAAQGRKRVKKRKERGTRARKGNRRQRRGDPD